MIKELVFPGGSVVFKLLFILIKKYGLIKNILCH